MTIALHLDPAITFQWSRIYPEQRTRNKPKHNKLSHYLHVYLSYPATCFLLFTNMSIYMLLLPDCNPPLKQLSLRNSFIFQGLNSKKSSQLKNWQCFSLWATCSFLPLHPWRFSSFSWVHTGCFPWNSVCLSGPNSFNSPLFLSGYLVALDRVWGKFWCVRI